MPVEYYKIAAVKIYFDDSFFFFFLETEQKML